MYISRDRKQYSKSFCFNCKIIVHANAKAIVQICVYIIKSNLVETLVFRKMQSSFADRLRRCRRRHHSKLYRIPTHATHFLILNETPDANFQLCAVNTSRLTTVLPISLM